MTQPKDTGQPERLTVEDIADVHGVIVSGESDMGGGRHVARWPKRKVEALKALAREAVTAREERAVERGLYPHVEQAHQTAKGGPMTETCIQCGEQTDKGKD